MLKFMAIFALALVGVSASNLENTLAFNVSAPLAVTACGNCCSYGASSGYCNSAFKSTPGICCGQGATGLFYCCPSSGSSYGPATCRGSTSTGFSCHKSYNPSPYHPPSPGGGSGSSYIGEILGGVFFLLIVCLFLAVCCSNGRIGHRANKYSPPVPVAAPYPQAQGGYVAPVYQGPPQQQYAYPQQQYGYAQQPVIVQQQRSGMNPGVAAGAGFLGGMIVGDMLAEGMHHHHHHGGDWGGGGFDGGYDGGGGGFDGGFDGGGGDGGGDFGADTGF